MQIKSSRMILAELRAEQAQEEYTIEGYFAVFNQQTELWRGAFEQVSPGAFDKTLGNDIRALINHEIGRAHV